VIERRIRAFDPFPGASSRLGEDVVKLWSARVGAGAGAPGTVLGTSPEGVRVACGEGSLVVTELQRPGGKRVTAAQFLQSAGDLAGQVFAPHGA
jgi:methionyl-tRNA formyltransferase